MLYLLPKSLTPATHLYSNIYITESIAKLEVNNWIFFKLIYPFSEKQINKVLNSQFVLLEVI